MIFTKSFIKKNESFNFPSFLFGKEIFFAGLNRNSKLKTNYIPDLIVNDIDHASTGKLMKSFLIKQNHQSMKVLTKIYFSNKKIKNKEARIKT